MPAPESVTGYWFSSAKSLPHGDGRRIAIGRTHKVKGEIIPCRNGLHASKRPLDALQYAPGPIVWKVRLSGVIVAHGGDKHCASERTYLAGGVDATDTLREFARKCALDVIDLWTAPEIVVRYLKTGDPSLAASAESAASAAWAARGASAESAESAANAAWAARGASAASAARAESAAWAARAARGAWAARAARGARGAKQNRRLTRMLNKAIRETSI